MSKFADSGRLRRLLLDRRVGHGDTRFIAGRPVTAHWWKLLAAGAGVLIAVIVVTTATGEVDDSLWWLMVATILSATVAVVAGLALGVAHLRSARAGSGAR